MMQPEVTVRQLRAEDADRVRALRLQGLTSAPTAFGASYEQDAALTQAAWQARLETGSSAIFGAFSGEAMVGIAGFHPQSGSKSRHRGLLWGVFVDEAHRGRGLARQLVERIITHAAQHVLILEAGVTASNHSAAALYESLGFQVIGKLPRALFVDGAFHDEILLALDLDSGASPA